MKKIIALLSLFGSILSTTTVMAGHPWQTHWPESIWQEQWQTNFLFGLMGGYADREGPLTMSVDYTDLPFTPSNVVRDVSDTGTIYGIFVGYQGKCRNWLLGTEFNLERHRFESSHPFAFTDPLAIFNWTGTAEYRRDWMTGLTFRVGYQFVEYFIPYFRIGIETGQDIFETTLVSNIPDVPPFYLQNKKWIWRFLSGVGIEAPIYCSNLAFRVEYQIHSKGKTLELDQLYTDGLVNPLATSQMQPKTQAVIFGVLANFS